MAVPKRFKYIEMLANLTASMMIETAKDRSVIYSLILFDSKCPPQIVYDAVQKIAWLDGKSDLEVNIWGTERHKKSNSTIVLLSCWLFQPLSMTFLGIYRLLRVGWGSRCPDVLLQDTLYTPCAARRWHPCAVKKGRDPMRWTIARNIFCFRC